MSSKVTCVVLLFIGFAIGVVLASRGLLPAGLMYQATVGGQAFDYEPL
jgi:hypothetical protein